MKSIRFTFKTLIAAASLSALVFSGVAAERASVAGSRGAGLSPAASYFTDTVLVNQDGEEVRFYSDLLEGKVIIMIPFFTTCTGICPPMNRNLEQIQEWLGDRLGKDVNMLSISVDPENDTVPRLKLWAKRYHAKPGWYFLGGKKENVDFVMRKIGQYVEQPEDHGSIMIIGNLRTGLWKKARALANIDDLIKTVESVVDDTGEARSN